MANDEERKSRLRALRKPVRTKQTPGLGKGGVRKSQSASLGSYLTYTRSLVTRCSRKSLFGPFSVANPTRYTRVLRLRWMAPSKPT